MAKHRACSIEFKRQIAEDFIAGETLHALASRHDISLRQRCAKLRHGSRLKSAAGRKFLRTRKIRLRLGGMPLLHTRFPPRPRCMRRKTYLQLRDTALRLEADFGYPSPVYLS